MKDTKYIFVTGGVLSGLGKGVSAASLGRLLKARGFKVFVQKLDPYYNTDPGTMSPYQHGEVYVTNDGAETDLDLGHYERFIGEKFTQESNYTQGRILYNILNAERDGKFDGHTVQVVPHVTNEIKRLIKLAEKKSKADFIITEIGGTAGDIESQPFIYAVSQFARENRNKTFFMHATYVPYLEASQEFKSKPTQQSIALLKAMGVFPDMVLLRANREIDDEIVNKVADAAMMDRKMCIPVPNVNNIYKVPLHFEQYKMAEKVLKHFGLPNKKAKLEDWEKFVDAINADKKYTLNLALAGKYVEYEDAYKSIVEALKNASIWNKANIKIKWIQTENVTKKNVASKLKGQDGVVILPGFGKRGFDGKVVMAEYTRDNDIPTFGICYGFQAMVVAQAKAKGIADATTSEVSEEGTFVIDILAGKSKDGKRGGTLRLGASTTVHTKGSVAAKLYGKLEADERHRHRYETNPKYIDQIEDKDFKFSGYDKKTGLAEVCEMPKKKFYLGVQAHPEFNSTPLDRHPLFEGFIKAVIKNKK